MSSQSVDVWLRDSTPEQWEALLDALGEGVIALDANCRVVGINRAACRMLESDKQRALMTPCQSLFGEPAAGRLGRICQALHRARPAEEVCWEWISPSGVRKVLRFLAAAPFDVPERGRFALLVFQDETDLDELRRQLARRRCLDDLVGKSQSMQEVFRRIEHAARTDTPVLIEGESGTGKELVARVIHGHSARSAGPFEVIDCSIPDKHWLDPTRWVGSACEGGASVSEASVAAAQDATAPAPAGRAARAGAEQAPTHHAAAPGQESEHRGNAAALTTLFLKEVGLLSAAAQMRLLRLVEQSTTRRAGGKRSPTIDLRIIAGSCRPLVDLVAAGKFREDLYLRLRTVLVSLPPLRQRSEDIPWLAQRFIELLRVETGRSAQCLSQAALRRMLDYGWPGNVRQLRSAVEYAALRAEGPEIQPSDLPAELSRPRGELPGADGPTPGRGAHGEPQDEQREVLRRTLEATGWNVAKAARRLKISRTTIYERIRRFKLTRPPE